MTMIEENITHAKDTEIGTIPNVRGGRSFPLLGIGLAILLATATFFSGMYLASGPKLEASVGSFFLPPVADPTINLDEFWQVWKLLEEKFAAGTTTDPISNEERIYGAIEGLVASYGDPYTVFLPPKQAELFEDDISGNFSGVGMEVGIRDDILTVIAPLPESPAEKAGILAGDYIVRIDGTQTENMSVDEAVRLIRGEKGTEVKLTLLRKDTEELIDISIVRDTISIPTSKTEIKDSVFVISLYSFNALAEAEMQDALRQFVKSGKKRLVLDLRGNPGGYLQGAVGIASYFLPVGKVVVRESFSESEEEHVYRSTGKVVGNFNPDNFVVLVDGGSASASEILAGALKEQGVATIIGEQTFGKGSVQELVNLSDGSSLKVTIARWLTPNGTSISLQGLAPTIEVLRTAEDREAEKDPQLDAAIDFLKKH